MTDAETWNVRYFEGSVCLVDWQETPRGQKRVFSGRLSILPAEEVMGFRVRHSPDANWIARVVGPSGESWNFPGCKVASITTHPLDGRSFGGNEYVVP